VVYENAFKRSSKSKRIYKRKFGFAALGFIDAERLVLIARLAEENYKSVYRRNYTLTFQSA